ncbi:hypothetical protein FACS1894132_13090 [Clostridia bacterium]|nr:hypothetical protein FACS1894132_13090 [Clostridia bacterium]
MKNNNKAEKNCEILPTEIEANKFEINDNHHYMVGDVEVICTFGKLKLEKIISEVINS